MAVNALYKLEWKVEWVKDPLPTKPPVRCGQRWRLDGVEVELYDHDTLGVYKARNWDGVRVKVRAADLKERGVFLSGPTEHETHAEAVRRVVDIEAANPPEGIGREEWRSMLINRIGDGIRNTGSVRMVADDARAEVAEKWRKFGGGR